MNFVWPCLSLAQTIGVLRGVVYDKDFDIPLSGAQVLIVETGDKTQSSSDGDYRFEQVPFGTYTIVISKEGYVRQVEANVVVSSGQMTDVNASLAGEFTEMEEVVAQDLQIVGTETGLLLLRVESPALLDSISSELISQAGAGDAASALKLVSGATVEEGKYAVIRGLPDRYVNSQMNGVRLPSADADKRAVQLDQFPSEMIESVQVSKTFTPDQQGDASGGAVNIVLKGIPDEKIFKLKAGTTVNSQAPGNDRFITYKGGGVNFWAKDDGDRETPEDGHFKGAVGVARDDAPKNYNGAVSLGGKYQVADDVKVGGFSSLYYKREYSYYENGRDDSYWVDTPGGPLTPRQEQVSGLDDFKTSLFDVTKGTASGQWGGLASLGVEIEDHSLDLLYMYTRVAEDTATLSEDTRGKSQSFPGYNRFDPMDPGNQTLTKAPYIRTETLQYTERVTDTVQLNGKHKFNIPEIALTPYFAFLSPEINWTLARSASSLFQPDKRQFGSLWEASSFNAGVPPFLPPSTTTPTHRPYKPAANFTLGNLQRVWKDITEEGEQYFGDLKFPFEQWNNEKGYIKFGLFHDEVNRDYEQDSFSNFNDNGSFFEGEFEQLWSNNFPFESHPVTAADIDVDYKGKQEISAWYSMTDFPLTSFLKVIGGARFEKTQLSIVNFPEDNVMWVPPGSGSEVALNPGEADVSFRQRDVLPSMGLVLSPIDEISIRGSYSKTVARQTFKELTPIQQQEFLGSDVFIGNPSLRMSALTNYDWRVDLTPYEGSLISASWFRKDIVNPIEYVQKRTATFGFTTPTNYPKGRLYGYEIELKQQLGSFVSALKGFSLGGNATFIQSKVMLPESEIEGFSLPNINVPMTSRDMTNAPKYLYNAFVAYDIERLGLQVGLFYTVKGDTLVAGAGQASGNFIPSLYEKKYGTLNFSLSKKFGVHSRLTFQAKNLLNPKIQRIYRAEGVIPEDTVKTSYQNGIEYSLGLSLDW